MSSKKKREPVDDNGPKQPKKKSADDENEEEGGGGEEDKVVLEDFLTKYTEDKIGTASEMQFLLARMFESYLSNSPLDGLYYTKKTLFPQLMTRLRRIVEEGQEDSSNWSFVLNLKKKKPSIDLNPSTKFSPQSDIETRLKTSPDEILIFSLTDLVCLFAALKGQRETLSRVRGRKTQDVSLAIVENLVKRLEIIEQNTMSLLRASAGTIEALNNSRLYYKGKPLSAAVQSLANLVKQYAPQRTESGVVAIYYDFADGSISTVNGEHIEVPSVRQLDEAYELMRQHPTRVILLDMREHYKNLPERRATQ